MVRKRSSRWWSWSSRSSCAHIEPLERRVLFVLYGPDISFGNGGVATGLAGNELLAELPDGKILAVGSRVVRVEFDNDIERDARRLNPDGTIDQTFANGAGIITLNNSSFGSVLAGSRFYTVTESLGGGGEVDRVIAYTTDGVVDTAFSGDGLVNVPSTLVVDESGDIVSGRPIAATPDGGVVLLVTADDFDLPEYHEIVKLKADGSIDTTFGDNGFFRLPNAPPSQIEVQWSSAGPILTEAIDGGGMELTRYLPGGSAPDPDFGDAGTLTLPSHVLAFAEQPDGKLLIVRSPDAGTQAVTRRLYRLNADGSPDTAFGQSGSMALRDAASASDSGQLVIDNQQRIVVVSAGQLYRFSAAGAADVEPLNGTFNFGGGKLAVDSSDRVLRGDSVDVTRFDVLAPVATGRNGVLYVNGDEADDDVAVDAAPSGAIRVTRNGTVTDTPAAGLVGVTLNLAGGNNRATVSIADLPVTVNTGNGADSITSAAGSDTINAGHGSNVVNLGDGNDIATVPSQFSEGADPDDHHQVTGGDGNKTITIDNGRATITLGTGNSKIVLSATHNDFVGDASLDDHVTIAGGNNDVTMYGGNDVLEIGGNGNNKVRVGLNDHADVTTGGGNDFIHIMGAATVHSNAGDDSFAMQLSEGNGELLIFAGDGNDRVAPFSEHVRARATIHGGNGNDYVNGGGAAQTIYGGAGNDTLWGGTGSDLISAGGGNDRVYAEGGADRVYGGAGRDRIYGGGGNDRLRGGAQGDWLYGNAGANELHGDGGNDRLYADYAAGGGVDTLIGGAGNDLLVSRDSLADQLFGGPGGDTSMADDADGGGDVLAGIETLS